MTAQPGTRLSIVRSADSKSTRGREWSSADRNAPRNMIRCAFKRRCLHELDKSRCHVIAVSSFVRSVESHAMRLALEIESGFDI